MKHKVILACMMFCGYVQQIMASNDAVRECLKSCEVVCVLQRVSFKGCTTLTQCNNRIKNANNAACYAVEQSGKESFDVQIHYQNQNCESVFVSKKTKKGVLNLLSRGLQYPAKEIKVLNI